MIRSAIRRLLTDSSSCIGRLNFWVDLYPTQHDAICLIKKGLWNKWKKNVKMLGRTQGLNSMVGLAEETTHLLIGSCWSFGASMKGNPKALLQKACASMNPKFRRTSTCIYTCYMDSNKDISTRKDMHLITYITCLEIAQNISKRKTTETIWYVSSKLNNMTAKLSYHSPKTSKQILHSKWQKEGLQILKRSI